MKDLVKRLRGDGMDGCCGNSLCGEAADEIERLRQVARSRRRKKDCAVAARNVHATGLDYWRERAMAAETALASAVAYADAAAMVEGMREGKQCKRLTAGEFPKMKVFDVAAARSLVNRTEQERVTNGRQSARD